MGSSKAASAKAFSINLRGPYFQVKSGAEKAGLDFCYGELTDSQTVPFKSWKIWEV